MASINNQSDIPFWGKQKPLRHYFPGGVIKFSVGSGVLYYSIVKISKTGNYPLDIGNVRDKEHLDKILAIKRFEDL